MFNIFTVLQFTKKTKQKVDQDKYKDKYKQYQVKYKNDQHDKNIFNSFKPEYSDEYIERFKTIDSEEKKKQSKNFVQFDEKDVDMLHLMAVEQEVNNRNNKDIQRQKSLDIQKFQNKVENKCDDDYRSFIKIAQQQKRFYKKVNSQQYQSVRGYKNHEIGKIKSSTAKQLKKMRNQSEIEAISDLTQKIIENNHQQMNRMMSTKNRQLQSAKLKVQKNDRQNHELNDEIMNLKQKVNFLQNQNNHLTAIHEKSFMDLKSLQEFKPLFNQYKQIFGTKNVQSVNERIVYLENLNREQAQQIMELEDQKRKLEKEIQQNKKNYEDDFLILQQNFRQNEEPLRKEEKLNLDLQQETQYLQRYKQDYIEIVNKITRIFTEIKEDALLYKSHSQFNQTKVDNPEDLLEIISKTLKISTPDGYFRYLRKIIISANQLQRKFFPESVNSKFEPEELYQRILRYFDKLTLEKENLQRQVNKMMRQEKNIKDKKNH